jgi:deoxyribose-phosphate aldolase
MIVNPEKKHGRKKRDAPVLDNGDMSYLQTAVALAGRSGSVFSKTALAKMIDHSLLRAEATEEAIIEFCEQAKRYHFASVVVFPYWVPVARKALRGSDVKVCTVIAFPHGCLPTAAKVYEARQAVAARVQEMDVVVNLGALKSGDYDHVYRDLEEVVTVAKLNGITDDGEEILTKIIIETTLTTRDEQERTCRMAEEIRADFIKTCTGQGPRAVSVEDVKFLRSVVGREMGIKAAGGIRTYEQAMAMINAGANRIGTSTGPVIVEAFDRVPVSQVSESNE